jgi:hypothetical protein
LPRLPAANEFTPGQLGSPDALFEILGRISALNGDRVLVADWIRGRWFSASASSRANDPSARAVQQLKRASNVITGMQQYGLLEAQKTSLLLTELGSTLHALTNEPEQGFRIFARFLLQERYGMELLQVATDVLARDGSVTKNRIDDELRVRGFDVATNSSYAGKLRQWLELSGVVDDRWNVDESVLQELGGATSDEVKRWRSLTVAQRAVVDVLRVRNLGNSSPIQSAELLELLRQRGVSFNPALVGRQIYEPLVAACFVERNLKGGGRGGKGGTLRLTQRALDLDAALLDGLELGDVPADLQAHLSRPTETLLADLTSDDTGVKGVALELLALRMASDLGLMPAEIRLRSAQTGGAEVDVVAEGAHLHFSRWLFQCKNQTAPIPLSVLAKEVGMATLLKAQVVVIVTTGVFARSVLAYAREASQTTSIQIVLLDGGSLANYRNQGPAGLREELHQSAIGALRHKRSQLSDVPRE